MTKPVHRIAVWSAVPSPTGTQKICLELLRHKRVLPQVVITGLARAAVAESRERVFSAAHLHGWSLPKGRLVFNLIPAEIPKRSASLDLAMAVALWQLGTGKSFPRSVAAVGEVGIDGQVYASEFSAQLAQSLSSEHLVFVPAGAQDQLIWCDHPENIYPIEHITQISDAWQGRLACLAARIPVARERSKKIASRTQARRRGVVLPEVFSPELLAVVALHIVGRHHLFLFGPPGNGKTTLPEVINALAPVERVPDVQARLLRVDAPVNWCQRWPEGATTGVSVLVDEFLQLPRSQREAWRQTLDDSVPGPASILTANPCPCGYWPAAECRCLPYQVTQYQRKLSGPLLDRLCIQFRMSALDQQPISSTVWDQWRDRIQVAALLGAKLQDQGYPALIRQYSWEHFRVSAERKQAWLETSRNWSRRRQKKLFQVATSVALLDARREIAQADLLQAYRLVKASFLLPQET